MQRAIRADQLRASQLQAGAQHGSSPDGNELALTANNRDDALSLSSFAGSGGKITPPGSESDESKPVVPLLLNGGVGDGYETVNNKKKRSRGDIDFSMLLTNQQPQPLDGIATKNYFQVLQTMEAQFELKDATANVKYGKRKQVVPVNVKRSDEMKSAKETVVFTKKKHTSVRKANKPAQVLEVSEWMLNDENTALLNMVPDKLEEADDKVGNMVKLATTAVNPDDIMQAAAESPLAFNSTLASMMTNGGAGIGELATLHAINRVLSATFPNEDLTFLTKWKKVTTLDSLPPKRHDLFKMCAMWWTHSDSITELARASKALGMFELALMSIAPVLFTNDHWIQYITGQPVEWIPAHHQRSVASKHVADVAAVRDWSALHGAVAFGAMAGPFARRSGSAPSGRGILPGRRIGVEGSA